MPLLIKFFTLFVVFIVNITAEEEADRIIRVISDLKKNHSDKVTLSKVVGGLTNDNYKAVIGAESYFIRCGRKQNYLLGASLETEWQCTTLTSSVGLSPKTVKFFPDERILVTEFIGDQSQKINLRNRDTMEQFCRLVRSLHRLPCQFPTKFCPFETINNYAKNGIEKGAVLPEAFVNEIMPFLADLQKNINFDEANLVPCHLDLHKGNVLNDGHRLWLIDWEYAAMGDPLFDIAVIGATDFFTDEEMNQLLHVYLGRVPDSQEVDYIYMMRILADARWALWCYLQDRISPLNEPFRKFGDLFIEQCLIRIGNLACCPL